MAKRETKQQRNNHTPAALRSLRDRPIVLLGELFTLLPRRVDDRRRRLLRLDLVTDRLRGVLIGGVGRGLVVVGLDDLVALLEERLVLIDREALAVARLRVGRAPARAVLVGPMGLCTRTRERNARSAHGEIEREKNLEIPAEINK